MEAKELMINDLVWYVDEPIKVKHNYGKSIRYDDDSKFSHEVEQSYTKPIPLTQEILKANGLGFKRYDDGYDEWEIQIDSQSSWMVMCIAHYTDGAGDWYIDGIPISYVHELQHALRLCGLIELADNFKVTED